MSGAIDVGANGALGVSFSLSKCGVRLNMLLPITRRDTIVLRVAMQMLDRKVPSGALGSSEVRSARFTMTSCQMIVVRRELLDMGDRGRLPTNYRVLVGKRLAELAVRRMRGSCFHTCRHFSPIN